MSKGLYADGRIARLVKALKHLPAAIWYRQSTSMQVRFNKGSALYQSLQISFLEALGLDLNNPIFFDAGGESAKLGAKRPVFDELVERVEAGEFGAVIASAPDRVSRNEPDAQRLYDALAEKGLLIIIGGRIYDPADRRERQFLDLQTLMARWDNEARAVNSVTGRIALAHHLGHRVTPPTGLTWVCPLDPETKKGLGAWLLIVGSW